MVSEQVTNDINTIKHSSSSISDPDPYSMANSHDQVLLEMSSKNVHKEDHDDIVMEAIMTKNGDGIDDDGIIINEDMTDEGNTGTDNTSDDEILDNLNITDGNVDDL